MNICYVVHRYSPDVRGGAELLCRMFAQRLTQRGIGVEVFTTTALDYVTWANELPEGVSADGDVQVRRFPVASERTAAFDQLSQRVLADPEHTATETQEYWMRLQGPETPALIETLGAERKRFDLVVFFTYLYYTTYYGIPAVGGEAILHPTAHDEAPIYLPIFDGVFHGVRGLAFSTEEERAFVQSRFDVSAIPTTTLGAGVSPPTDMDPNRAYESLGSEEPFLLYVGRIDEWKGSKYLCEWFAAYKQRHPGPLKLVLAGQQAYVPPEHPDIALLGVVSEELKWDLLAAAELVVLPSFYESLSLLLLESWAVGTPVLVNGYADVCLGHCRRSNGGLWYHSYAEFEAALVRLLDDPPVRRGLGSQGRAYTLEHYTWDAVMGRYQSFLEERKAELAASAP